MRAAAIADMAPPQWEGSGRDSIARSRRDARRGTDTATFVASLGFAFFLTINATQVWGGIFPFLPADFQTQDVTLAFYLAQAVSFVASLAVSVVGSYWYPEGARRMLVVLATTLVGVGSLAVIAAMYVSRATMFLVAGGGVSLGVGTAAFFMLWQRLFSSQDAAECNRQLMIGTVLSALLYYALYLVPAALTAFLIPVILLPIGALCLVLSVRMMDFEQPMFADVPREHPHVYRRLVQDCWRSAVGIGALGFCAGLARGVAVVDPNILGEAVNIASMAGSLLAAAGLLLLWRYRSARFGMNRLFRSIYPLIMTGILLFPFFPSSGLSLFAGITYLAFSAAVLVMMMQAAQISRDRGTNPVFAYGLFAVVAYGSQVVGFLLGWYSDGVDILGVGRVALFSLLAAYVMGMAMFVLIHRRDAGRPLEGQIELISRARIPKGAAINTASTASDDLAGNLVIERTLLNNEANGASLQSEESIDGSPDMPSRPEPPETIPPAGISAAPFDTVQRYDRRADSTKTIEARFDDQPRIRDRISKQCLVARDVYMLSTREAEVMELIVRGYTVSMIAEELFISENTVRTHSKHIYTKLDVHSKAELAALLGSIELG